MKFPLSPKDFLPLEENDSKEMPFSFRNKSFAMKVSYGLGKQYFIEIIPDDKTIKGIAVGYIKDIDFIWDVAIKVFEYRFND